MYPATIGAAIMRTLVLIALTLIAAATISPTNAQPVEKRVALVIGNAAYPSGALPTTANDAGLIAQTLQAAGFDVTGARDLDQDTLRRTFREFLDKVSASGPDTVAFIYLAGYGVQLEGENYFVPVDAKLAHDTDLPLEALRLSDYMRPLSAVKIKAGIVVLDAARASPFAKSGEALASGLSLVEPDKNMLIAFNAAPGTVAPAEQGPYGAYAQALAEMIRTGGLSLGEVFERTRLRVNEATKGGEVPWHASKIEAPIVFFDRAAGAPAPPSGDQVASIRTRPIRDLGAQDAYVAALERDTLQGYLDFLDAYPNDAMAKRVRAIVAARREALTWRRTRNVDTPPAYWSYLRRYPDGPHGADARRRLAVLAAAFDPPPTFPAISYDIAPPPVEEEIYFRRPVLVFDDPVYAFAPPPPPPVILLPPPPPDFVVLRPPPPVFAAFVLPVPDYVPMPVYYSPPPYVVQPPPNIIYNNIHNTVVINNNTKMVTITSPGGTPQTVTPAQALAPSPVAAGVPAANAAPIAPSAPIASPTTSGPSPSVVPAVAGAAAGAALLAPTLPSSAARKANAVQPTQPLQQPTRPNANPAATTTQGGQPPAGQTANTPTAPKPLGTALPGAPGGQPLPANNKPPTDRAQTPGHATPLPPANSAAAPPQPGQKKATSNAQGTQPTTNDRSSATQQTSTKPALTGNKPPAPERPVVQQTPSHASSAPGAPQPPRNDNNRRPAAGVNVRNVPPTPPPQRPAAPTVSVHTNPPPVARPVQRQAIARPASPPPRPMVSAPPARPVAAAPARPMMATPPRPAPVARAAPPPSKPCHPSPGQQCK